MPCAARHCRYLTYPKLTGETANDYPDTLSGPPNLASLTAECCTYLWCIGSASWITTFANKNQRVYLAQINTYRRQKAVEREGLRRRAGASSRCWRHEVAGRRSVIVFDRFPGCACCLLGMLFLTLALDHDTIPDVQIVGPIDRIRLLIFTTVSGVLPAVRDALVYLAVFELLALDTTSVDHYAPTSPNTSPVARLVLKRDIIWRRTESNPSIAPWCVWRVCTHYRHGISTFIIRNGGWRGRQLRFCEDRTEV